MPTRRSARPAARPQAEGSPFHGRIADNVVPQIDVLDEEGWSGEERKIIAELRKILELPDLDVAATAVRVPVHTGHSVALHFRTEREVPLDEVMEALAAAPGLEYRPATAAIATRCRSTWSAVIRCWSAGCGRSRVASEGLPSS